MSGTIGRPAEKIRNPYSRENSTHLSMGSLLESLGHYESLGHTASGSFASEEGHAMGGNEFLRGTGSLSMMQGTNRAWEATSQSSSRSASRETPEMSDQSEMSSSFMKTNKDKLRGQGYRKLFQQVTKVGRGQKLSDTEITVRCVIILTHLYLRQLRQCWTEYALNLRRSRTWSVLWWSWILMIQWCQ